LAPLSLALRTQLRQPLLNFLSRRRVKQILHTVAYLTAALPLLT
jgi:hypothetical protein